VILYEYESKQSPTNTPFDFQWNEHIDPTTFLNCSEIHSETICDHNQATQNPTTFELESVL
jgi:hypothetical protein